MGVLLTLLSGIGFIGGVIINKIFNDNKKVEVISISLAFVILFNLIFFDIIPELDFSYIGIVCAFLGILLLKIFDLFIPHHHHEHKEINDNEVEHSKHLNHISIISVLALSLHNLIECIALYNVTNNDFKSGLLMCLAINLHNLPLGIQISLKIKSKKFLYIMILVFSGLCGGLLSVLFGSIPSVFENYILFFTLGMLIYLFIFEISLEMIHNIKNKYTYIGIFIGLLLVLFGMIL